MRRHLFPAPFHRVARLVVVCKRLRVCVEGLGSRVQGFEFGVGSLGSGLGLGLGLGAFLIHETEIQQGLGFGFQG